MVDHLFGLLQVASGYESLTAWISATGLGTTVTVTGLSQNTIVATASALTGLAIGDVGQGAPIGDEVGFTLGDFLGSMKVGEGDDAKEVRDAIFDAGSDLVDAITGI